MATPLNDIIREHTTKYLSGIDAINPPSPRDIEKELLNLVNTEINLENVTRDKTERLGKLKALTHSQIADILTTLHHICRVAPAGKNTDADQDLLAMYMNSGPDKGIYVTAETHFRSVARQYNYSLTTNEFKEVMAALKDQVPRRYRCQDPDLVPVNNGIFNYATKELLPFTPDQVLLSKSHVDYVPNASSPVITMPDGEKWEVEKWMASLSDDPEIVELLWQIVGAIIRPHVRWNKSAWLYSERGNNGKGTLCELMRNVCGPTSYASIPLANFGQEFLLEPLTNSSAIIVDENDVGLFIDKTANLKAVITNDVISINRKYKTPISYQFYGFMVQCLNEFPRIKDRSESFYRRQLFIPMTKNFNGIERRYIKSDYLARDDVLQYVLHKVLHMDYYVLSEPEATKQVLAEYKISNDPVRGFWDEFEEQFTWDLLPFGFLYDLYRSWFNKTNPSGSPVSNKAFIKDLLDIIDQDPSWYCTDKSHKIRSAGKMVGPEPLITTYDLHDWMNPIKSKDPLKNALPVLAVNYRGIIRQTATSGTGPIGVMSHNETLDNDDLIEVKS